MIRSNDRLERDKAVLTAAELEGDEREEFLRALAVDRPELAHEVRRRVERAEAITDSFLETPAAERLGDLEEPAEQVEPLSLAERYEIGQGLGEGGMGKVYLAHDRQLGREVAMKLLHRKDRDVVSLLLREARLQARVQHEHVLEIYDSGLLPDGPFIAMQYVGGGTLADVASDLPLDQRVRLLAQAAEGLHAAHRLGLVHRDVKPSNVLLAETGDGDLCAKVADFGLAGDIDATSHVGDLGGTPYYVAPERLLDESDAADRRSDVYSLGVTMYRVFTGSLPFEEQKTMDILRRAVQGEFVPPRERAPHLPAELESIILRCMARDPEDRYPSAKAVADDLRRYLDGEVVEAYVAGLAYRLTRFVLRNRALVGLAGAALVALLAASVAVAVFAVRADRARGEAEIRRGQAEELIGFMVGDLQGKLAEVGRLEILEDVGDRAMAYFEQVPEDALTSEEKSRRAQALRQIGQVRRAEGDLNGADEAFRRSLELTQALAAATPDDSDRHVELCAALFWVGQVRYDQGRYADALPFMQRYLEIAEAWAERNPDDATWSLELSQATSNVASVSQRLGDFDSALRAYQRRLAIVERLVVHRPDDMDLQLDLALAHNTRGFALESVGRLEEARSHFEIGVEIKLALVQADPDNLPLRQQLATSHYFLGQSYLSAGRLAMAQSQFEAQLGICQRLVVLDPKNGEWRRNLAVAQRGLAQALLWAGETKAALAWSKKSEESLRALVAERPKHADWDLQLAKSQIVLGRVLLREQAPEPARDQAAGAVALLERTEPASPGRLADALLLLGSANEALGRSEEARSAWLEGAERLEPRIRDDPRLWELAVWVDVQRRLGRERLVKSEVATLRAAGYRESAYQD